MSVARPARVPTMLLMIALAARPGVTAACVSGVSGAIMALS